MSLPEFTVDLLLKRTKHEYSVQLEGDVVRTVSRAELANGVEPFGQVSLFAYEVNRVDQSKESGSGERVEVAGSVYLSQCSIKIAPERNTMSPGQNYEKIMFLQACVFYTNKQIFFTKVIV